MHEIARVLRQMDADHEQMSAELTPLLGRMVCDEVWEEDLARAFFSARHTRTLDGLGYLTLQRFRLYAEEGLAGTQVAVWVQEDSLTVEYGGEALSRYEVECEPAVGAHSVGKLRRVKGHTLYETSIVIPQPRPFDVGEVLGEVDG